jgi:AcrR family transcriptional regulator
MGAEPGLRERKKRQTRERIAETARRLFVERGFEAVTVAMVAREADVAEGTVFNYFPTKEDLFYSGLDTFEAELVEAVRNRPAGESVLAAFRGFVLDGTKRLADEDLAQVIANAARIIGSSPALQTREREIVALATDSLAKLIAEEAGTDQHYIETWAAANALMGIQRALVADVRAQILAGRRGARLAKHARSEATRAFARLENGLGDYALKPTGDRRKVGPHNRRAKGGRTRDRP